MASLKFIMDVTDDHPSDGQHPPNIGDKGADKLTTAGQLHEAPTNPHAARRYISSPGFATDQYNNDAGPSAQTKRRGASSRATESTPGTSQASTGTRSRARTGAAVANSPPSTSSPSLPGSETRPSARRRSTTSGDPMDRTRYGPTASSSLSTGGGPQRPMPPYPAAAQLPTRITPKTGRISKAQKGLPVHVCNICKPPKTFTRAEHLRRHQLGHGAPQFQCLSCDRAFHRSDLLARHQQKHEQDGDRASNSGSAQASPQTSPTATAVRVQQSPGSSSSVTPSSGPGPGASHPATEILPTSSRAVTNKPAFSQQSNPAPGSSPIYGTPRSSPQDFQTAYTLSPRVSVVNPTQPSSLAGHYPSGLETYEARTGPPQIYVVTQGLQQPSLQTTEIPELHDTSPWPSSASDSTYSTPVSEISRTPRPWVRGHLSPTSDWATSQRLAPYPSATPRGAQSPGPAMGAIPTPQPASFISSYSPNPQMDEPSFGGVVLNVSSIGFAAADTAGHHHTLAGFSSNTFRPHHHRHSNSISSVRSQTPPLNASPHPSDILVTSAPSLPSRQDPLMDLDRRKGMVMGAHPGQMNRQPAIGGMDVLGDLAIGYGPGVHGNALSPGLDYGTHERGIMAELDLAMGGGCAMPMPAVVTIPLPGPVRAAIPRYLEVYWAQVDPLLPLVHRQSFEAAPEDVLNCAMAALATQYLDTKDGRARGNILHEFAWLEVKRVPQWTLQTMHAILLCEHFARFRGRKAVTRPSKPFESLCMRALYHNPALLDRAMLTADQQLSVQDRWRSWIDAESRRRLLAACLVLDGHAAVYQQQRRVLDYEAGTSAALQLVPLTGRSTKLWEASSAEEWAHALAADPGAGHPEYVPPLEQLTAEDVSMRPPMDQVVILSVCALRLPRRQRQQPAVSVSETNSPAPEMDPHTQHVGSEFDPDQQAHHRRILGRQQQPGSHHHVPPPYLDAEERITTLFPHCPIANTYLALHHTPLRDLLAVGGDSWVFSQKVLPATSFHEHQKRLKTWVTASTTSTTSHNSNNGAGAASDLTGLSAARATVHAARAILGFLDRRSSANPAAPWGRELSDYWALYVCALICWAFNHRARGAGAAAESRHQQSQHQHQQHRRQRSSSGSSRRNQNHARHIAAGSSSSPTTAASASTSASTVAATITDNDGDNDNDEDAAALGWLRCVAAEGTRLEDVVRARGRREAAGVVGLVRRRLESDCFGGRSRLYVDAVRVLRKVEEGGGWKWF
ncbi:hypothetical protein VTK56DRAFT_6240 [Thermocarpiscus australiensis]